MELPRRFGREDMLGYWRLGTLVGLELARGWSELEDSIIVE